MPVRIKPTKRTEAEKKADIEKRAKARLAKEKAAQAEEQGYRTVKAMDKKRITNASKASKQEEKTKRIAIRQGEKTARVKARHGASAKFPEIKEKNEGKFTAWVEKNMGGMDTCKAASKVMRSRTKKYSPAVVKMANYANNFGCKTKKEDGASLPGKEPLQKMPTEKAVTGKIPKSGKQLDKVFDSAKGMGERQRQGPFKRQDIDRNDPNSAPSQTQLLQREMDDKSDLFDFRAVSNMEKRYSGRKVKVQSLGKKKKKK